MITTRRTPRAFTLLELLVAIGVVAVLIGVLLPVLAGARRSALSASCLNNLRSLGQAIEMYRGANHDLLPYAATPVHLPLGYTDPLPALGAHLDAPVPVFDVFDDELAVRAGPPCKDRAKETRAVVWRFGLCSHETTHGCVKQSPQHRAAVSRETHGQLWANTLLTPCSPRVMIDAIVFLPEPNKNRRTPMMTRREAMIGTAVVALSALIGASVALASRYDTPGWEYGRSNCGPATSGNTTRKECEKCCDRGMDQHADPITLPDFRNDCKYFCSRAMWPRRGWWPW